MKFVKDVCTLDKEIIAWDASKGKMPYKRFLLRGAIFANFADLPVICKKYNLENELAINNNATPYSCIRDNCIKPRPWIELHMTLLKFLKKSSVLPHLNGSLSERLPSSSIAAAKKEVNSLVVTPVNGSGVKRGRLNYGTYSDEERARVGKKCF